MLKSTTILSPLCALAVVSAHLCISGAAWAQALPVTSAQKQTANEVAQRGVPLSEIAADAPDRYTVKSGDTLWAISKLYLKTPWRWPELWGMNMSDIKNPHRIYPGQTLYLERKDGMARLRSNASGEANEIPTVKMGPRNRITQLADSALPTLKPSAIEPFLAEPFVIDEQTMLNAPRIVSAQDGRVLLTRGDRAYTRGVGMDEDKIGTVYRVFREATPLKDPGTGEILGYEAQYVGKAALVRAQGTSEVADKSGDVSPVVVPATVDIVSAKSEMRVNDRLLADPDPSNVVYTPRAAAADLKARIVSVYGTALMNAAQNQVVTINRGSRDGVESGQIMSILKDGAVSKDKTDPDRVLMKLPNERNGLLMVFRVFDRVSYALILDVVDAVRVGDHLVSPSAASPRK